MNIISIISCFDIFLFFQAIVSLHYVCYYFYVLFYWPLSSKNRSINVTILFFWFDRIICLQKLRGYHRVFMLTVQNCKCSISELVILRFDQSHRYLYIFHIIYFCYVFYFTFTKYQKQTRKNYLSQYRAWLVEIRNSERYRAIVENSGTPFRKVSDIYWNYGYYGSTHLTNFIIITYYWVFHFWIYFQHKKPETRQ